MNRKSVARMEEGEGLAEELPTVQVVRPAFSAILISFFLHIFTSAFCVFIFQFLGAFTVGPQEHVMVVFFGRLVKVCRKPGLYYYSFFGRTLIRIPTSTRTFDFKKTTVVDANGNPIVVAGVVTYRFADTVRTAFDVLDAAQFVEKQALAVLKQVCSRYPYESQDGHSLQNEAVAVGHELCRLLQDRVNIAGAVVVAFELADLQYAPEIASGMLVRQQAAALVAARKLIVEGAVSVVTGATEQLEAAGHGLEPREKARLTSTLLAVICGEANVKPVYNVGGDDDRAEADRAIQMETLTQIKNLANVLTRRPQ